MVTVQSRSNAAENTMASTHSFMLAKPQIDAIAQAIDKSSLFCQKTELRKGYKVYDLGRYTLNISSKDYAKELFIDTCHTIPDTKALHEILNELDKYKNSLGSEYEWGPYATASSPGTCADENQ